MRKRCDFMDRIHHTGYVRGGGYRYIVQPLGMLVDCATQGLHINPAGIAIRVNL